MTKSLRSTGWTPTEEYDDNARWLDDQDGGDRWRDWASCRDEDPTKFFPVDADGEELAFPPPEVMEICDRCPVRGRCLNKYMDEPYGIFGGTTGYQRQLLTKKITRKRCVGCGSTDLVLNGNMKKEACLGCGLSWDVL